MDARDSGALAGIVTPPLFAATVLAQDYLRDDFDPVFRFISELSIGSLGWIQIANFIVHGFLSLIFARGVRAELLARNAPLTGATLLTVFAVITVLAGVFVTDPSRTPPSEASWHGTVHLVLGFFLFSLLPIISFVFFRCLRPFAEWRSIRRWSLVTLVVTAVFWLAVVPGGFIPSVINIFGPWIGTINRLVVGVWLLWMFLFALRLRALSGHAVTA
jgi:Protein of unknown function (DUF998)